MNTDSYYVQKISLFCFLIILHSIYIIKYGINLFLNKPQAQNIQDSEKCTGAAQSVTIPRDFYEFLLNMFIFCLKNEKKTLSVNKNKSKILKTFSL